MPQKRPFGKARTQTGLDSRPVLDQSPRVQALSLFLALVFTGLGLGCLVLVILGLPGTWLMIAMAAGLEMVDENWLAAGKTQSFGWWAIGTSAVLALAGEVLETWAAAAGLAAGGGSRRGMWGAIAGGLVGGLLLTGLVPIPVVGTVLGAALGAFGGAFAGEFTAEQGLGTGDSMRAAAGAAVGRIAGTFGKTIVAIVIWVVLTVALFWNLLA